MAVCVYRLAYKCMAVNVEYSNIVYCHASRRDGRDVAHETHI